MEWNMEKLASAAWSMEKIACAASMVGKPTSEASNVERSSMGTPNAAPGSSNVDRNASGTPNVDKNTSGTANAEGNASDVATSGTPNAEETSANPDEPMSADAATAQTLSNLEKVIMEVSQAGNKVATPNGTNNASPGQYVFQFHKKGQALHSSAKVIVMNVYHKLKQENPEQSYTELLGMTASLTGVSPTSIKRMNCEFRTLGVLTTLGKKRPNKVKKGTRLEKYNDFTLSSIMKIVHTFRENNEMPTAVKVAKVVNEHPDLPTLCVRTIRRLLKDLGIVLPKRKRGMKQGQSPRASPRPCHNLSGQRPGNPKQRQNQGQGRPKQMNNFQPRPPNVNLGPNNNSQSSGPNTNQSAGPSNNLSSGSCANIPAGPSSFGMFNTQTTNSQVYIPNFQVPCMAMGNKFAKGNHTYEYVMNQFNGNHN